MHKKSKRHSVILQQLSLLSLQVHQKMAVVVVSDKYMYCGFPHILKKLSLSSSIVCYSILFL